MPKEIIKNHYCALSNVDMLSMQKNAHHAVELLKCLANEYRLMLICTLAGGELSVGELNQCMPFLSQSALSQHLAVLRDAGLVNTRRQSQSIVYYLSDSPGLELVEKLNEIYSDTAKSV
jgi:DNA-binding transcriptional ArsR family regulator